MTSLPLSSDETVTTFSERVNLLLLIPHGRAGSFFIQSLFDGHEEVISFPSYFVDYGWNLPNPADRLEPFVDRFCREHPDFFDSSRSYINDLDWVSPALLGDNQDEQFRIDLPLFRTLLIEALNELRKGGVLGNRHFLVAIHFALGRTLGRRTSQIQYILFHQHGGRTYRPHVDQLLQDFPNLYFIAAVRDLRESWASFKSLLVKRWGQQNFFNFFIQYLRLNLNLYNEFLDYYPRFPTGHVKVVDLHRLHLLQEEGMRILAEWLAIEPSPVLSQSTFLGKKWWGNAADGKSLNGFSVAKAAFTWRKKLDPWEVEMIEFFSSPLYKIFGQEPSATHPSAFPVYRRLFFSPPLFNWPRRDSLLRKKRRAFSLFTTSCYFTLKSFAFFLLRYSWRDLRFFELRRSGSVSPFRYEEASKAVCL